VRRRRPGAGAGARGGRAAGRGRKSAIRWTKHTLNNWYRQTGLFDASLAYEFFGFGGPDAREGLASHVEKRPPEFDLEGLDRNESGWEP
jgi:hypothetical protein